MPHAFRLPGKVAMKHTRFLLLASFLSVITFSCRTKTPDSARAAEGSKEAASIEAPEKGPATTPSVETEEKVPQTAPGPDTSGSDDHLSDGKKTEPVKREFDQTLGEGSDIDPFGASHEVVVREMLKMVGTGKNDVVYDLGSGDGRIPIMAAKDFKARGVGIELREELVTKSREVAKKQGVSNRVRFIHGDIFKTDISPATVVTLYLFPRTNLKLRPKLLSDLRPGTRIVAHDFGIEGWPRDAEKLIKDPEYPDYYSTLYFWVVPANVSGEWQVSVTGKISPINTFVVTLEQSFQQVRGQAQVRDTKVPIFLQTFHTNLNALEARKSSSSGGFLYILPNGGDKTGKNVEPLDIHPTPGFR